MEALAYDRSTFSDEFSNWLDLRDWVEARDSVAWCYGAPGAGLSRLGLLRSGNADSKCSAELDTAFYKTLRTPPHRHSLCHGAFGNFEFLSLAAEYRSSPAMRQQAEAYLQESLDDALQGGFLFDSNSETLNLMLGTAGIAHAILRHTEPENVPSMLLLEPPKLGCGLHQQGSTRDDH